VLRYLEACPEVSKGMAAFLRSPIACDSKFHSPFGFAQGERDFESINYRF
jgi:hypothetical protein